MATSFTPGVRVPTTRSSEDPVAPDATTATAVTGGIGAAHASTLATAPLYPFVEPAHGAAGGSIYPALPETAAKADPISYPVLTDPMPSAPPAESILACLADVLSIQNPEVATSYLNAPIETLIPKYTKVKHGTTTVDTLLSQIKKEANKKGFTLNLSLPVDPASTLGKLGNEIVKLALAGPVTATAKPLALATDRLSEILSSMDTLIAGLHNKNIPADKRALIEVALRSFCTQSLHTKIAGEFFRGSASFHPQILTIMEDLNKFLTKHGAFKPVIDVKTLVAAPVIDWYVRTTASNSLIPDEDAVEKFEQQKPLFREHLHELFAASADPRKHILMDKLHAICVRKALPELEKSIVTKAIMNVETPGAIETFAAELRSLKVNQSSFEYQGSSYTKLIQQYFDGLSDPAQKTVGKKLDLFNLILSSMTNRALKAVTAIELRDAMIEMEKGRYEAAAASNQLPGSWIQEFNQIADCLTRNGAYADAGQAPLQLDAIIDNSENTANILELINGPLLQKVYGAILASVNSAVQARRTALGHELTLEQKVSVYLEQIGQAITKIVEGTEAPSQLFAKVFMRRFLHNQFAKVLDSAALSKSSAQRDEYLRTGYLPLEMYGDAIALHNLETRNGVFATGRLNALQRQITHIFGTLAEINDMLSVVTGMEGNASNTAAQTSLFAVQRRTLEWAASMLSPDATELAPPPMLIAPARPMVALVDELTRTQRALDSALAEVLVLRGTAQNGTIHEAWLNYMQSMCQYIIEVDTAIGRGPASLNADELARLRELQTNNEALKEAESFLNEILGRPGFGETSLGLFTIADAVEELNTESALAAKAQADASKAAFNVLKAREVELVGDGKSATATVDASGAVTGYDVEPSSEAARLFVQLQTLAARE